VNAHLGWYVARAGGLVAWVLASMSVVWGLAMAGRAVRRRGAPAWLLESHRWLGGLTLVFTAIHVGGLVADRYVHFGMREIVFPFASTWRPGAVAWGVVSLHLLVAIQVTSWLKRSIRRRLWHAVHLSAFLLFGTASAHAFTAGSDVGNPLVQWTALSLGVAFLFLVVFRVASDEREHPRTLPQREPATAP
jgi:hypothetical protein